MKAHTDDARSLSFACDQFDAAFGVSVLEHIPGEGDTAAIRELVRVVRPGGHIVVTVPYDQRYRETFVRRSVYERTQTDNSPVFFERHYDGRTLEQRLLGPSGATLVDLQVWGENAFRCERALSRLGWVRDLLSPVEALLAWAFLRRYDLRRASHPMAALVTLAKPTETVD